MGKYKKGVLGPFRGKVGTVVGSSWNGIFYLKSLPDVGEDNPTPAQLNVRAKMSMVVSVLKRVKPLINVGYQQFNKGVTPMNAATSYHLASAVTGANSLNYAFDYEKLRFSVGQLRKPIGTALSAPVATKVDFAWLNNAPVTETGGTDRATFLVYNPTKDEFVTLRDVVPRSALTYSMQLPPDFSGDTVYAWMSFTSVNGKEVSDSVYVEQIAII